MSTAQTIHEKFFPPARPIVKVPILSTAAIEAAAEQRGYDRGFAEAKRLAAIEAALRGEMNATLIDIAEEVALKHRLRSWRDLRKRKRTREFVIPRQEAMWRAHRETDQSLPAIGRFFGGYDHTTVLHAIRAHEKRALIDSAVRNA